MVDPLQAARQEMEQKQRQQQGQPRPVQNGGQTGGPSGRPAMPTQSSQSARDQISLDNDDMIELAEEPIAGKTAGGSVAGGSVAGASSSGVPARKIIAFGNDQKTLNENWKRQPVKGSSGSCRVKSFHGKYSDEGLRYLDHAINTYLDEHPEIEVKFVTSTVMVFEGKIREPALVLNCWF